MKRNRLVLMMAAWLPLQALADVTAVTLYPGQASVTREESATLQPGAGTLEIADLPAGLMERTLRVSLAGTDAALVRDVRVVRKQTSEAQASQLRELRDQLQQVNDSIGAHNDAVRAWRYRLDLLDRWTSGDGEVTLPDNLNTTADSVFDQAQKSLTNIRRIEQEKRDLVREQDRLKRELAALGDRPREVAHLSVGYTADRAADVTVKLEYQTRNAGWSSAYEARLDSEDERLQLIHQAVVHQNTGEDWNDVQVSLSTGNPAVGGRLPDPSPWILQPRPQPQPEMLSKSMVMDSAAPATAEMQARGFAGRQTADLVSTGLTQQYQLAGTLSLADGVRDQRLTVSEHDLAARLSRRVVPALSSLGYVFGEADYQGEATLPAAEVALYQDGQYVGQHWLEQTEPGQPLAMAFGVDDRLSVKVVREQDQRGEKGILSGRPYLERMNRFEITNAHDQAVDIRVIDRLPVSRHDDIEVSYQGISEPYQSDIDDKPGVIAWDRQIGAGETLTLKAGFEVKVPEGQDLPYLP